MNNNDTQDKVRIWVRSRMAAMKMFYMAPGPIPRQLYQVINSPPSPPPEMVEKINPAILSRLIPNKIRVNNSIIDITKPDHVLKWRPGYREYLVHGIQEEREVHRSIYNLCSFTLNSRYIIIVDTVEQAHILRTFIESRGAVLP